MDPRQPKRSDGLPNIGDYSAAHDARRRQAPRGTVREAPAPRPRPAAGQRRAADDQWLLDPSDMRRHTQRLRQGGRKGPFAKLLRYATLALAAAATFGVYWNFDTLREIEVSFAPWRSSSGVVTSAERAPSAADLRSAAVAAPVVVGSDEPIEPVGQPSEPEPPAADTPIRPSASAASPAESELPAEEGSAASALPAVPPDPEPAPAAPPPPPPEPETFVLGLPTLTVSESDAAVAVLILRNGDDRSESFVTWRTSPGTATPGVDYVDLGTVTERFPPGAQNRTIRIPIVGDAVAEGDETFYIHLEPEEDARGPADRLRTEVVITDDD